MSSYELMYDVITNQIAQGSRGDSPASITGAAALTIKLDERLRDLTAEAKIMPRSRHRPR
jgi:hypothetical protein